MLVSATYRRYSSDRQREASLVDQDRECDRMAAQLGAPAPIKFEDAEISGERRDRPGYMALMQAAEQRRFNLLVLWDLKRLSRAADLPQVLARLRFWGVRVVTCDGFDSDQEGSDIRGWIDGLMGNRYLRELAKNTHRGLTGRALEGASAGGLPYGYSVTETGYRAIREDQAVIVRRIFAEYLAGRSARQIAAALNREGIPSGRGRQWAASAIHGDVRRGIGILANPIYVGRQVWNRSRKAKHPETGRPVRQERPPSEWIITEHPELAIIDAGTWAATERRLRGQSRDTAGAGRSPQHLLSGILRCGACGGPMVVVDRYRYGCANAKQRGTCAGMSARKAVIEPALLGGVQAQLLSDEAFAAYQRAVKAKVKPDDGAARKKLAQAEAWHANIMRAIRAGVVTASTKADLEAAERAVALARAETQPKPAVIVPRVRERWHRIVRDLTSYTRNATLARNALIEVVGDKITLKNENGDLVAEIAASQIALVAGAGFEPATFGL